MKKPYIIIILFIVCVVFLLRIQKRDNSITPIKNIPTIEEQLSPLYPCKNLPTQTELIICYDEEAKDTHLLLMAAIQQQGDKEYKSNTSQSLDDISNTIKKEQKQYQDDAEKYCKNENKNEKDRYIYSMKVSMCVSDIYKKDLKEYLIKHSIEDFNVLFPKNPIFNMPMVFKQIDGTKDHIITVHRISKGGVEFRDETIQAGKVVDSFTSHGRLHDYFWLASGTMDTPEGAVIMSEFNFELKDGCAGSVAVDVDGKYAGLNISGCKGNIYKNFNGLYEISKN